MVSLEIRNSYISQLIGQTGTCEFAKWLSGLPLEKPKSDRFTDASEISHAAMYSVQGNHRDLFAKVYESLCRRKPEKESPYIFNDILIFSTMCGVLKYKMEGSWLMEACKLRLNSSDAEVQEITQAYCEILKGNLYGTTHCPEIAVTCSYLVEEKGPDELLLKRTYNRIAKPSFPPYNSIFLNAIAIKAFDVIVESKTISNQTEYEHLLGLNKIFESKSILVANIIWLVVFAVVVLISVLYLSGGLSDLIKEGLNRLSSLKSVFGVGSGLALWPLLSKRRNITELTAKITRRFWGEFLIAVVFVVAVTVFMILLW